MRSITLSLSALVLVATSIACTDSDDSGSSGGTTSSSSGGSSSSGSSSGGSSSGSTGDGDAGACVASGTTTNILDQVDGALGRAALDDQYVYVPGKFADGHEGVERFPRAGGPGVALATTALASVVPDLAVLAGTDIYFVGASSGKIYKVPAAGGAATYTEVASGYQFFSQRRLVADANAVYVLGWKASTAVLDRIPLSGDAPQTLATLPDGTFNLALFGDDVWFSGGKIVDTGISHVAKSGGTPERVLTGRQCLNGFAVTADSFFCADTNAVTRIPRDGGTAATIYSTPSSQVDRVEYAVFSDDGAIAYVADGMNQANTRAGRILKIDVASTTTTALACDVAPLEKLALGPNGLVATGNLVGVGGKYDLKLMGR